MRAGQTSKPCHGCGEADTRRPTDGVCRECRTLLAEAKAAREAQANVPGRAVYVLPEMPYWATYWHAGGGCSPDGVSRRRDAARDLFHQLAVTVSEPVLGASQWGDEPLLLTYKNQDGTHSKESKRWFRTNVADLLGRLEEAIRGILTDAYDQGREDGHSLIGELAAGRLSVADLNERTVGRKLKRAKR